MHVCSSPAIVNFRPACDYCLTCSNTTSQLLPPDTFAVISYCSSHPKQLVGKRLNSRLKRNGHLRLVTETVLERAVYTLLSPPQPKPPEQLSGSTVPRSSSGWKGDGFLPFSILYRDRRRTPRSTAAVPDCGTMTIRKLYILLSYISPVWGRKTAMVNSGQYQLKMRLIFLFFFGLLVTRSHL